MPRSIRKQRHGDDDQWDDAGEDERRTVSEGPMSPRQVQKMAGERGIIEEMNLQKTFPMDPKIKKDMKD